MSLSTVLDVVLGMVFIYFLLSRFCSVVFDMISNRFQFREHYLRQEMKKLFGASSDGLLNDFYRKPSIAALSDHATATSDESLHWWGKKPWPADIAPDLFTQVIVTQYTQKPSSQSDDSSTREYDLTDLGSQSHALAHIAELYSTVADFQTAVKAWYTQAMDRATTRYRSKIFMPMFFIGLLISVACNADSIRMLRTLWDQPTISSGLALDAQKQIAKLALPKAGVPESEQEKSADVALGTLLNGKNYPIGWTSHAANQTPGAAEKASVTTTNGAPVDPKSASDVKYADPVLKKGATVGSKEAGKGISASPNAGTENPTKGPTVLTGFESRTALALTILG